MKKSITSLFCASFICVVLIPIRIWSTGYNTYLFLIWNLFLAWLPLFFAFIFYRLDEQPRYWLGGKRVGKIFIFLLWVLFVPNSFYLFTDIMHLMVRTTPMLVYKQGVNIFWFDLCMIAGYSITSAMVGLKSLVIIKNTILKDIEKRWFCGLFLFLFFYLCSVGIYLGRFLRINSWEAIFSPHLVLKALWEQLQLMDMLLFSLLFSVLLIVCYSCFRGILVLDIKKIIKKMENQR